MVQHCFKIEKFGIVFGRKTMATKTPSAIKLFTITCHRKFIWHHQRRHRTMQTDHFDSYFAIYRGTMLGAKLSS